MVSSLILTILRTDKYIMAKKVIKVILVGLLAVLEELIKQMLFARYGSKI